MIVRRPGQKLAYPAGYTVMQQASSVVPRWLSGGISSSIVVAAYEPKGATSLANSYVNKALPGTYDCTVIQALSDWNAVDGWIGAAASCLSTGITAWDVSWSAFVRFTGYTGNNTTLFGSRKINGDVTTSFFLFQDAASLYITNGAYLTATKVANGSIAIAGKEGFSNGATVGVIPAGDSLPNGLGMYIFALNENGVVAYRSTCKIQYLYVYNSTITPAQVAALHAATA